MHIEPPEHAPATLRAFLRQYAMIVLSILTALGLEQLIVRYENSAAAAASRIRIEAELAATLKDLHGAQQSNTHSIEGARAALKALLAQLKSAGSGEPVAETIDAAMFDKFNISMPAFERSAWDCAIADQSASHLAPADLRRYSEIYALEIDLTSTSQLLLGGEWITQATSLMVDHQLGKTNSRKLADTIARYLLAMQQLQTGLAALESQIAHQPP